MHSVNAGSRPLRGVAAPEEEIRPTCGLDLSGWATARDEWGVGHCASSLVLRFVVFPLPSGEGALAMFRNWLRDLFVARNRADRRKPTVPRTRLGVVELED